MSFKIRKMAPTLRGNVTFKVDDSAIAQSAEQMTVNHWVPGSSPGRGAKFRSIAQLVARLLWEQDVGSSSLSTPTKF